MAKLSPAAEVKERFGSKEALAEIVKSLIERPEGLSNDDYDRKVRTLSNRKLLKLHAAHEDMTKGFGSKEGLVDAIIGFNTVGKVDQVYRNKLMTLRAAQLLGIHKALAKKSRKA